ncbi:glycosyltransferase family protein [Candidatus Venteria ishoeyi]|uniref:Spore protein YkvP/CgeB glycosyl transferase-like domain-containing protein n=1 Tax=Candidatus Venteria ishoeyi TaxID=1899563 RepID=A0A1H6FCC5_9GAMM|nr:glycosyltransferase [Candidatus Venteria ishoeyi]SEH07740.1 Uncharacterised protein [Candidatus Venteria ishoeyi]
MAKIILLGCPPLTEPVKHWLEQQSLTVMDNWIFPAQNVGDKLQQQLTSLEHENNLFVFVYTPPLLAVQYLNTHALLLALAQWEDYVVSVLSVITPLNSICCDGRQWLQQPQQAADNLLAALNTYLPDFKQKQAFQAEKYIINLAETVPAAYLSLAQVQLDKTIEQWLQKTNTPLPILSISAGSQDLLAMHQDWQQQLKQEKQQQQRMQLWLDQLEFDIQALLASWRWKLGDHLIRLIEIVLRRPKVQLAADHLQQILGQIHRFKQPVTSASANIKPAKKLALDNTLRLAFAVTDNHPKTTAGDYFTASELGQALNQAYGWEISYLARADWYHFTGIDVLIVMLDDYELDKISQQKKPPLTIAWMRNWFTRWAEQASYTHYDIRLASSQKAADFLTDVYQLPVSVLRIATNAKRFQAAPENSKISIDYCFTGSRWDSPRDIEQFNPAALNYQFAIYGKGWDNTPQFKPYLKGFLPYTQLAEVYQNSKILLDDANHVTKPWASVNSRVFDALAAGVLVLSNGKAGAEEVFAGALPVWETPQQLADLLGFYLENPQQRQQKVQQLRQQVLAQHTYAHRAITLKQIIQASISKSCADKLVFALKIAAPNQQVCQEWGDYHFACGVKKALEQQGHAARIDMLDRWYGEHCDDDNVTLVLRGLSQYLPRPDQINLLWNISHPDKISDEEYETYDLVFIASEFWAEKLKQRLDVPLEVLLQCTDPDIFYPESNPDIAEHELLFIGNSRLQNRPIVFNAIQADLPLTVYGNHWHKRIPEHYIAEQHIQNQQLRQYYSRCKVLLNDHWDAMRQAGFISNRLFDACACNAKIISDAVAGVDLEVFFQGAVSVYDDTPAGLKQRYTAMQENPQQHGSTRDFIKKYHSFEQRAKHIVKTVKRLRNGNKIKT